MICYLLLTLFIVNHGNAVVQPEIHIIEGGSFIQYVLSPEDIRSCNVSFNVGKGNSNQNITFGFDPYVEDILIPLSYEDKFNLSSRMVGLPQGYCGFKLINSKKTDPENWIFSVTTTKTVMETPFRVLHYGLDKMHIVQKVTVGLSTTIECGRPITQSQDFCQIYSPSGEFIFEGPRCNFYLDMVTMSHLGTWRCVSGLLQSMDTLEYTVDLISADLSESEGWVKEADEYYKIGCRVVTNIKPSLCRLTDPTGQEYVIRTNLATERYTALQTNLLNKTCGVEIPKPLLEHEFGIWKCNMEDQGTLLYVDNTTDITPNNATSFIAVNTGDDYSIKCNVPFTAESCYIVSPIGKRFLPDVPTKSQLGECSLSIKNASKTDDGTWTCFFVKKNEISANAIKFEVHVRDVSCTTEVKVDKGGNAELSCKTESINLQYCWFMSPTGTIYHLFDGYTSEEIAYSGRGLEYGDCGIAIFKVEDGHYGNWSCIVRKGSNYRRAEEIHLLKLSPPTTNSVYQASSFGIVVGLIVSVMIAVVIILKNRKKSNLEVSTRARYHRGSTNDTRL
ncbi:hypothetical protein QE152_g17916 [Popillia japonica]|uniref:Immunoglobulin domain-containing protein n=1 Tax=Popillia japonica TaxID=7064 RepID=A0AAW1L572_POPJA